jgi:DNA-directed RNA polymerase specialized sigma24 family protein
VTTEAWDQTDPILRAICEYRCADCLAGRRCDCARKCLTPKELETVKLLNAGYGQRKIARALGIDKSTVRERLDRAERKIRKALDQQEEEQT